jgi:hypothetical protein
MDLHFVRMKSLQIVFIALLLSLFGHFILFFGLPFLSFNSAPTIADDLIIRTDLKPEPPKKIQMSKAPKKLPQQTTSDSGVSAKADQNPKNGANSAKTSEK